MFGKRITLFRLLGFAVRVDVSWIFIAGLVTWSLHNVFRDDHPELSSITSWLMAAGGMLGLFGSVVFHELSHSLVARSRGMRMSGITLFLFGGVAEMEDEPPNAAAEFWMAIVGPFSSLVLAAVFFAVSRAAGDNPVSAVLRYLSSINVVLALFNLIPGFPLDGGRVLRAALWGWKKRLRWATRVSSQIGALAGFGLIAFGIWSSFTGNPVGGVWLFLIGMFLRSAAQSSYRQLVVRRALEGEPVHRFMQQNPVVVTPDTSLADLVENYVYRHMFKMFPVVGPNGSLLGCVSIRQVKEVPRSAWSRHRVAEYMEPCSIENSVSPYSDALRALSLMTRRKVSRLLVVDGGRLVGVLALKDLMRFLSLKIDLDDGEDRLPQNGGRV